MLEVFGMNDECMYIEHAATLYPLPSALLLFYHFSMCVFVYFHNCSTSRIQFKMSVLHSMTELTLVLNMQH